MNSILTSFVNSVELNKDRPCFWYEHRDQWFNLSWNKFAKMCWSAAAGWRMLGVKPGDRVALFGPTAWEWTWADMSLLAAGAIVVPIYQTLPPHAVDKILEDANIKIAVGDRMLWENLGHSKIEFVSWRREGSKSLGHLLQEGNRSTVQIYKESMNYDLDKPATIVYTSGTTGDPKGVVITHKNIAAEIHAIRQAFAFPHTYVGIACLPLSHVLGRMIQFFQLSQGCQIAYVPDLRKLPNAYKTIKPQYMCAVPRLLEKINEGINTNLNTRPLFERKLFSWAKKVGESVVPLKQWHHKMSLGLKLKYFIANFFVFKKIRKALGGNIKVIISGGAPLSASLNRFLHACKMPVFEGYGLTETFAAVTINRMDDFRIGTIGKPIPDVEVKFAEDKELLIKGDVVFPGYWNREEKTKEVFTKDGWFKSGDLGEFTRDGFIRLTGRKKDIIITAGGKNISPTNVEDKIKEIPFVTQAVLYGDGRKFLSALLSVDPERLRDEAMKMSKRLGEDLSECPISKYIVNEAIQLKNTKLASFEQVKKFIIIPSPFTIEGGELTPTLKVRRELLVNRYKEKIDELYKS